MKKATLVVLIVTMTIDTLLVSCTTCLLFLAFNIFFKLEIKIILLIFFTILFYTCLGIYSQKEKILMEIKENLENEGIDI